ncbi:MAG: hypothetical protein RR797_05410 [Christensenella sp.]
MEIHAEINEIIELKCAAVLQQIKDVIDDDTLDDIKCFERIEKIIRIFEKMGSDGGNRHDFG